MLAALTANVLWFFSYWLGTLLRMAPGILQVLRDRQATTLSLRAFRFRSMFPPCGLNQR